MAGTTQVTWRWHPDGYVEIRDRDKDIIISGGENISTIEVEQAVSRHPAVMEAAVVAIPDEKWGERPKAFVVLKQGQEATEEEIIDFQGAHRPLQGPRGRRVHRVAQDLDRQSPEVRPARQGMGGARKAGQLGGAMIEAEKPTSTFCSSRTTLSHT